MKILITGFNPFGGESTNPAFEAIKRLPDSINGHQVFKYELPTVFNQSIDTLRSAIDLHCPNIVICVGQAGGNTSITIEKVAINLNESRIPDNAGNQPLNQAIYVDGPTAYFSSLPCKSIVHALHQEKIPATISYSAGTYVCNHVFYGLMYLIEHYYPDLIGGFIHVPYLPEQVLDKGNQPSMSLTMIANALETAIIHSTTDELSNINTGTLS